MSSSTSCWVRSVAEPRSLDLSLSKNYVTISIDPNTQPVHLCPRSRWALFWLVVDFIWGSVGVKNPRHRSLLNIYRYLVNIDRNLLEMAIHLNIDRFLLEKCQFVSARQRDYGFRMLWCAWLGKSEGQPTVSYFRTSRPISPEYVMQPEIPLWSVKPSWFYHVCSITSTSKRGLAK